MKARRATLTVLSGLALGLVAGPSQAVDVEKKWRLSLLAGGMNPVHTIESEAGNRMGVFSRDIEFIDLFIDPRDDSAVFGNLDMQAGPIATISAQYAVTKIFLIEASVGYQVSDLGDVEVSAQFENARTPIEEINFAFETFRINAGEVTRVPIQLTALARLRPRAKFNPYFGAGLGYAVQGYDPSDEFNQLSVNMDRSLGRAQRLTSSFGGDASFQPLGEFVDLDGARVSVEDTFEWHLVAGAEIAIKRKWAVLLDLRWSDASRDVEIGFNGATSLGRGVPQVLAFGDSIEAQAFYGPVLINEGGLIDGGSSILVPQSNADPNTNCETQPTNCILEFQSGELDGVLDLGNYYVQGGTVSTDGWTLQIGFRYTF